MIATVAANSYNAFFHGAFPGGNSVGPAGRNHSDCQVSPGRTAPFEIYSNVLDENHVTSDSFLATPTEATGSGVSEPSGTTSGDTSQLTQTPHQISDNFFPTPAASTRSGLVSSEEAQARSRLSNSLSGDHFKMVANANQVAMAFALSDFLASLRCETAETVNGAGASVLVE